MEMFSGILGIVIVVVLIIQAILWFLVPFKIDSMEKNIDKLVKLIQTQNKYLPRKK